jgi:hypothetical protein
MATLCFFDETIHDQDGKTTMLFEVGRSSYHDEDSLYMVIDGKPICVNRATATKFVRRSMVSRHICASSKSDVGAL